MKKNVFLIFFLSFCLNLFSMGNLINNSSFEDENPLYLAPEKTYGVIYKALLRCTGFFDLTSQTSNPDSTTSRYIPDYTWFKRGISQWQVRCYIDPTKAHSGEKSMAIHNTGRNANNATATIPWCHNLAQKVNLDNSKSYEFSFYVQRDTIYKGIPNKINTISVGIISYVNAVAASNYTYFENVTIPNNENWNKISVVFDLPKLIDSIPKLDFSKAAVFISMKTGWNSTEGKTRESKINIDDVVLLPYNNLANETLSVKDSVEGVGIRDVLLRTKYFFNDTTQSPNPNATSRQIPLNTWYKKGTEREQCIIYLDTDNGHNDNSSIAMYNTGGDTMDQGVAIYAWHHCLAQKVQLDTTKTYKLSFWVQKKDSFRNQVNDAKEVYVGIYASNENSVNYTYYKEISLPQNKQWNNDSSWNKVSVTFDIPELRSFKRNKNKDFTESAFFIAMKTGWNSIENRTTLSKINIDDIELSEVGYKKDFHLYDVMRFEGKPNLEPSGLNSIKRYCWECTDTLGVTNFVEVEFNAKVAGNFHSPSLKIVATEDERLYYSKPRLSEDTIASRLTKYKFLFKKYNNDVQYGNYGIAPPALNVNRHYWEYEHKNSTEEALIQYWKKDRRWKSIESVDVLYPSFYIVTPDIVQWKQDFERTITELRKLTNKKIIPYIWPQYYNTPHDTITYFRKIVDKDVWYEILESVYDKCDGAIIWANGYAKNNNVNPISWNDSLVQKMWSQTQRFIRNYNIQLAEKDSNILRNGDFENEIYPSQQIVVEQNTYTSPLRSKGYFKNINNKEISDSLNPDVIPVKILNYVWFKRGTEREQCLTFVENRYSYTGNNSIALYNTGGDTDSDQATAKIPWHHCLAQKVLLDNTKTYELSFYVKRNYTYNNCPNDVNEIYVGIVSSTDAKVWQTNYTYCKMDTIPRNENWNKITVQFDLPAIIAAEAQKGKTVSFDTCAITIGLKTKWDDTLLQTRLAKVNLDNFRLIQIDNQSPQSIKSIGTNVSEIDELTPTILHYDGKFVMRNVIGPVFIYDIYGRQLLRRDVINSNDFQIPFDQQGIYIVKATNICKKIVIQ